MQVQSQGREDPLENEMATLSSILAWRILWTEEPGGLQSMGLRRVDMTEATQHTNGAKGPSSPQFMQPTQDQDVSDKFLCQNTEIWVFC